MERHGGGVMQANEPPTNTADITCHPAGAHQHTARNAMKYLHKAQVGQSGVARAAQPTGQRMGSRQRAVPGRASHN